MKYEDVVYIKNNYSQKINIKGVLAEKLEEMEKDVYSDQCVPLARCFRASLTEGENHLHGD